MVQHPFCNVFVRNIIFGKSNPLKYNVTFCLVCGVELLTDVIFMDFVDVFLAGMVNP